MDILKEALNQGIWSAIVVAIYLLLSKIIDNKKEKSKIDIIKSFTETIQSIDLFLKDITKNIINKDKEKALSAIDDSFKAWFSVITQFTVSTIINNNIDKNKNIIKQNIHNLVNSSFYNIYSTLYMYKINNTRLSEIINKEWINVIEEDIVSIIFNKDLCKDEKIMTFTNKINIKINDYSTYVTNKVNEL